jgi:hypothetical protein
MTDDSLALIAVIISLVLLIFINFKIFTSSKKTLVKISLFLMTLLFTLPFWYLIQFVVIFTLARTVPQNKIVNCFLLNEKNCEKRSDCVLSYHEGGLGEDTITCGYK